MTQIKGGSNYIQSNVLMMTFLKTVYSLHYLVIDEPKVYTIPIVTTWFRIENFLLHVP